jgi:hypothetical protein
VKTRILAVVLAALVAGCATPNLTPFADQTAALAGAIEGEQREVALKFAQVIQLYEDACRKLGAERGKTQCEQVGVRRKNLESFDDSRRVIDDLMQRATVYAVTLAELAKAGETGSTAAQSLVTTVKQFGSVLGIGGAISAGAADTLQMISQAATRLQAQRSLADASEHAHEAVGVLADGVVAIYKETSGLAIGLYSDEYELISLVAGEGLVALFQDASAGRDIVNARIRQQRDTLSRLGGCDTATGDERKGCDALKRDLGNAEDLRRVLDRLRPDYEAVVAKRAAALRWREQRSENAKAIVKAAGAWKEEHARAAQALKRCGGINAYRCVELNAATLKGLIDRVNEIRQPQDQ